LPEKVTNQEEAALAAGVLRDIQARKKCIEAAFEKPVKQANSAHKSLTAWRSESLAPWEQMEKKVKGVISAFQAEETRKAKVEADRLAAEKKAKADADLQKAADLEAAGDTKGAGMAMYDAMQAEEQAAAPVTVAPIKVAGVATRTTWKGEVQDLMALVKAVAEGTAPASFLVADSTAINAFARAMKDAQAIAGVRFYPETTVV
jgi:hypothetical protein